MLKRWRVWRGVLLILFVGISCSNEDAAHYMKVEEKNETPVTNLPPKFGDESPNAETTGEKDGIKGSDAPSASTGDAALSAHAEADAAEKTAPLLIYNGTVKMQLYDIAGTQKKIVALVESEGGWVSMRSDKELVLRVPAAQFRSTLDGVAGLGDGAVVSWEAEDVTAAVRDTRIRLDSALAMRERLQELLIRAHNVKDALAIEEQLGRVILEIEQLQAALRGYKDRIVYSTITVKFWVKLDREISDDEFSLPFAWLDHLGAQRLLKIPRL